MDGDWRARDEIGDEGFADGDSPDDEAVPMDTALGGDTDGMIYRGSSTRVHVILNL